MTESVDPEDRHYSVRYVAEMFEVSEYTVRQWIKDKKIEAIKLPGGSLRIHISEVRRLANRKYGDSSA